jgi:hypothetical protein
VAGPQAETGGRSWRVREIDNDEGSRLLPTVRFTPVQRREIKKIAKSRPAEHGLPFAPNLAWLWIRSLTASQLPGDITMSVYTF